MPAGPGEGAGSRPLHGQGKTGIRTGSGEGRGPGKQSGGRDTAWKRTGAIRAGKQPGLFCLVAEGASEQPKEQ